MRKLIAACVVFIGLSAPIRAADITNPGPCAVFGAVAGTCLQGGGPLGTPSSGTVTNLTGTASININGTVGATTPGTGAFTTLTASGLTSVTNATTSTSMTTGAFQVTGGVGISGPMWGSTIYTSGASGAFVATDRAGDATNLWVIFANSNILKFLNNTDNTDWLTITKATGVVNVLSTTTSTSSTTGALKVAGGMGIVGDSNFGGQAFLPNATTDAGVADATACLRSSNGQILKGSGTLGICLGTSGAQFKTAFAPMAAGIEEIAKIKLWNYRYREGFGDSGARVQYGSTAQDVEVVLPDLVRYDEEGTAINYDIGAFVPIALHALQQLKAENDDLRACSENWKCRLLGMK